MKRKAEKMIKLTNKSKIKIKIKRIKTKLKDKKDYRSWWNWKKIKFYKRANNQN